MWSLSIRARPGRPNHCCRSRPGRRSSRQPGARGDGARRRSAGRQPARPRAAASSRFGDRRPESYILPIDECFRLVGLIRLHWKGLSGGTEVWTRDRRLLRSRSAPAADPVARGGACLTCVSRSSRRGAMPFAAVPLDRLQARSGQRRPAEPRALRHVCAADPDRSGAAPLRPGGAGAALRSVRRARALEHDAAVDVVDARDHRAAAVRRAHGHRRAGPVHVRFQHRRNEVFPRRAGRRRAAELSLQRHGVLRVGPTSGRCWWRPIPWDKEARIPAAGRRRGAS